MLTVVLLVNSYSELILKRYSRCVFKLKNMSTLRQRLKEAKQLLKSTYDTTISYAVVCRKTDTHENAIDIFQTLEDAKYCIKGINEQSMEDYGWKTRLYILPIVVDADSYEQVTEENMNYYDLNSEWVKEFKKERESWFN